MDLPSSNRYYERRNRALKNVFEAASARRRLSKKHSLHRVNEHFETIFNTAIATQIVFQPPVKDRLEL